MQTYDGALDRGLEGVVACSTGISSIVDATLCYRGYKIEDLAKNASFEEVIYLLWNDKLPSSDELQTFKSEISGKMNLEPEMVKFLSTIPTKNVHPMAWLRSAVSVLAHWDNSAEDRDDKQNYLKAINLTAKIPLLVALFHRIRTGGEWIETDSSKSIAWNFLKCLKGENPDPEMVKVFDTCLVLHADHELNCSAFTARVVSSSLTDVYSSIVGAIGALKGPLHGGANEQVIKMLLKIGDVEKAKVHIENALANREKIMGFGHRVYKNGDPRAKILRSMSKTLCDKFGCPHIYAMSEVIDNTVQSQKGLLPNVDFYSASVYYSMGIEPDLYTPVFAASRVSGWLAHIIEQWQNNRIYRPRGKWVGKENLTYS